MRTFTSLLLWTVICQQSLPRRTDNSVAVYQSLVERGHGEWDLQGNIWNFLFKRIFKFLALTSLLIKKTVRLASYSTVSTWYKIEINENSSNKTHTLCLLPQQSSLGDCLSHHKRNEISKKVVHLIS